MEVHRIPTARGADPERVRREEGERLLGRLREGDRLVVVDERGKSPSSEDFAEWINQAAAGGARRLVFAIGGAHGHDEAVRSAAWRCLSLSSLVLNHELARAVLLEQIYRATTILWGGGYHHA